MKEIENSPYLLCIRGFVLLIKYNLRFRIWGKIKNNRSWNYIYSMKNLKPNLYVIKNGKLQVKERENEPSIRVLPYSRSVRANEFDTNSPSLA